jgi:sulfide:quinone oxidoreductase
MALRALAEDHIEMRVVTPERDFVYRPLAVAEPFDLAQARRFDMDRLLARFRVERFEASATRIDPEKRVVVTNRGDLPYDVLVVAAGARPFEVIDGALTVGVGDGFARLRTSLAELGEGDRVVIAIPAGSSWTLPAYELALMSRVARPEISVTIASPEASPLAAFGQRASHAVAELLDQGGIEFHPESHCAEARADGLERIGAESLPADLVVAMPGLRGPSFPGLPHDANGFIPVDEYCRVTGVEDVFAAGDATTFPIKQGGLAAQQAVVAARQVAAAAGAPVATPPFEPVLRGVLLTGSFPAYLRADIKAGMGVHHSDADMEPTWWPPSKIATEHLSQLLAAIAAAEPLPDEDPFLRIETDDIGDALRTSASSA